MSIERALGLELRDGVLVEVVAGHHLGVLHARGVQLRACVDAQLGEVFISVLSFAATVIPNSTFLSSINHLNFSI